MKKRFVRAWSILLVALLLISCLPAVASATATPILWASPVNGSAESARPISAVKWWYDSGDAKYYLFMPSDGALSATQLWFENADSCSIDGSAVTNGQTVALEAKDYTVNFDGTDYPVCIMKSANIGSLYITTESGSMDAIHADPDHEYRESGMLKYVNAAGKVVYHDEMSEIKGRGNATWSPTRPKKPYQFKLPKKQDLIGAGKHKTWILLANYLERTLVRNKVIYDLANDAGLSNSCESTYVDLYCNGEYRGTYQLCEKVQIGDNRIEINDLEGATEDVNDEDLDSYPRFGTNAAVAGTCKGYEIPNNPSDITGGYLLEIDKTNRYPDEVSGFVTDRGVPVVIKEPECASREQVEYISNYFQEYEDAVFADDGINPTTGKRYDEYFDLTSLARKYIIEELTKNIDADETSQYYYKPSDQESTVGYCGPVWDYDNSMGNYKSGDSITSTGIYAAAIRNRYYKNLYKKESFLNAVRAEWESSFVPLLQEQLGLSAANSETKVESLDSLYQTLSASAAMNFTLWENIDTVDGSNYYNTGSTYTEHFAFLKTFLSERCTYLSSVWSTDAIQSESPAGTFGSYLNILDFNGTAATYVVDSEEGLQKLADLVTAGNAMRNTTILQTKDITLTKPFTPGGQTSTDLTANVSLSGREDVFRGTFNGQGYKIYNLNINQPENNGVGLFASAYKATFIDVNIAGGTVIGGNRVGGIAGYGDICTFIRCSNAATITASDSGIDGNGGLAGVARSGAVFTSCYNTGSITGGVAGGICGWGANTVTLTNCYNAGTVTASKDEGSAALARSSYADSDVTDAFSSCYYLNGQGTDANGATAFEAIDLTNCNLLLKLSADSGVWEQGSQYPVIKVGDVQKLVRFTARTYLQNTLLSETILHYAAGTEVSLTSGNDYFVATRKLNGAVTQAETAILTADTVAETVLEPDMPGIKSYNGAGTYYVSTPEELQFLLDLTQADPLTGSTVYLITDIDASSITTGGSFGGTLNGKFSTLNGLSQPLFEAVTATGDVRKLILQNATVTGDGVIAAENAGTVAYIITQNLVVRGTAGIVGSNSGLINACSTGGYVISDETAGGIACSNTGIIRSCINQARIVAPGSTAAGITAGSSGTVQGCLNTGMLNGAQTLAITNGTAADSYHWDWCGGTGNSKNACTDAEIAKESFITPQAGVYWAAGEKSPAIKTPGYELGDVNGDELIRLNDAVLMLHTLSNTLQETAINTDAADLNGSGLQLSDVSLLLRHLIGSYTI